MLGSRALRPCLALATAATLLVTGCAGLVAEPPRVGADLAGPEFDDFRVARGLTTIERESRVGGDSQPKPEVTKPVFWTGIVLGTIGAAGTIGFAAAGRVSKDRLNGMYDDASGSKAERDDIRSRGETWNAIALTSGALMAIGFTIAIVTYGVDWNRCGPLAAKKRRCAKR